MVKFFDIFIQKQNLKDMHVGVEYSEIGYYFSTEMITESRMF